MSNGNGVKVAGGAEGPKGPPPPSNPGQLVLQHAENALRIQPVPQSEVDILPSLEGSFELLFVARHVATTGKAPRGGGIVLHTGLKDECEKLRLVAREILQAYGANVVEGLMDLTRRAVETKKAIHEACKIVRPDGQSVRCGRCGQMKPCKCPNQITSLKNGG